jgi:hypothetical protein
MLFRALCVRVQSRRVVLVVWFHEQEWPVGSPSLTAYRNVSKSGHFNLPRAEESRLYEEQSLTLARAVAATRYISVPSFHVAVGEYRVAQLRRVVSAVEALVPLSPAAHSRNRVVIVTGARSGIGLAVARQLAAVPGTHVVAVVRSLSDETEKLQRTFAAAGHSVEFVDVDVGDVAELAWFARDVRGIVARALDVPMDDPGVVVDAVVHNAGVIRFGWRRDAFDESMRVQCTGPLALTSLLHLHGLMRPGEACGR